MVYCSYCGEQLSDGAMFCVKCGKKVVGEVSQVSDGSKEIPSKLVTESNNKESEKRVQAQSGKSRAILKTVLLGTVIILIGWAIMSWYSHSQQKKDFIAFYKNTQNSMQQLNSITSGIQDENKVVVSNRGGNGTTEAFVSKAATAQIELKKIRDGLERIEIPSSFSESQKSDAHGVIKQYTYLMNSKIRMLDHLTNSIQLVHSGKGTLANKELDKLEKETEYVDRCERIANVAIDRMMNELGIVEKDVN